MIEQELKSFPLAKHNNGKQRTTVTDDGFLNEYGCFRLKKKKKKCGIECNDSIRKKKIVINT